MKPKIFATKGSPCLRFLFISLLFFCSNSIFSQNVLCAGVAFNTNSIFSGQVNCVGSVTYQIAASTVPGISNTTNAAGSYTPTGSGTFTLQAWQGSTMCHSEVFNVVDFEIAPQSACFTYDISLIGNIGSCTADYTINGNAVSDVNNIVQDYNFSSGGVFPISVQICGSNGCTVSRPTTISGPDPAVAVTGESAINNFPLTSIDPVSFSGQNLIYPLCIGAGNYVGDDFNFQISDETVVYSEGMPINYTGSLTQNATTITSGPINNLFADLNFTTQGYQNFTYTVSDGNCASSIDFSLYMVQPVVGAPSVGLPNNQSNYCFGDVVNFIINPGSNNIPGSIFELEIACSGNVIFTQSFAQLSGTLNFPWTATQSSCGCGVNNNLNATLTLSTPCYSFASNTQNFLVQFDNELEFDANENYCLSNFPITFQANGLQNVTSSGLIDCVPDVIWELFNIDQSPPFLLQATNQQSITNSTDPDGRFSPVLAASGNYRVCLTTILSCGSTSNTFCQDFCVSDDRVITPNFGIDPSDLISGSVTTNPVICIGSTINPGYSISGNFSCTPNTINWTVSPNGNGATINGVASNITATDTSFTLNAIGTYRIRYNAQGNCLSPSTGERNVTVAAPPSVVINSSSPTYCEGDVVNLDTFFCISDNLSPITNMVIEFKQGADNGCDDLTGYSNLFSGVPNTSVVAPCGSPFTYSWTVPPGATGIYTFRVRAQNGCGTSQACFQVSIGVPTNFSTPLPSSVCAGSTLQLSNFSPTGGNCTWQYWNGSSWINLNPVGNVVTSLPINNSTNFRVLCSGFCPLQATVNVFPPFTVSLNASQNPVCVGNSVTINAVPNPAGVNISSYNFSGAFGSQNGASSSFILNAVNNGGIVNLTATSSNGCTASANLNVTLSQGPNLSTNNINRCETDLSPINLNQLLTSSGGGFISNAAWEVVDATGQVWVIPNGQNNITTSNIIQQFGAIQSPSENFTLEYSFTNSANCTFSGFATITIQAQSESTINVEACANVPISIPSSAGQLVWVNAPPSSTNPVVGQAYSWTPQPSDVSSTPYVLQAVSQCALVNTNYTVRYFDLSITAAADTICAGDDAILNVAVNPPGNYTYEWCSGLNCSTFSSGTASFTGNNIQITTSFSARVSDISCSYTESIVVHVDEQPTENNQLLQNPYCEVSPNAIILLDNLLSNTDGENITTANWALCGDNISSNSLTLAQIIDASLCGPVSNGVANYQLSYTYNSDYCPYSGDFTIQVLNQTEQSIPLTFCAGELVTFAQTGDWADGGTLPSSAPVDCANCNFNWQTTLADVVSNGVLRLTDNQNCSAIDYLITINPTPVVTATTVAEVCVNESVVFESASDQALVSSVWSTNGVDMVGNNFSPTALGFASGATIDICFSGENQFGCSNQDCFEIDILGLPSNTVLDNDGLHCIDQSLQLPNANGYNYSVDFTLNILELNYQEAQSVIFPENGFWQYEITATTNSGCTDIQQGQLQVLTVPLADIVLDSYDNCNPIITLQNNSVGDNATYTWTSPLLNNALTSFEFSPSPLVVPTTLIDAYYPIVFELSSICGTSQDEVEVYFQAAPTAFLSSTFESGFNCAPICGVIDVDCPSTNTVDQITYTWNGLIDTNTGQNSLVVTSLDVLPNVCFDVQSAVDTEITVEVVNACGSASDTIPLIVVPPQVAADFIIENTACPGSQLLIIDQSFPEVGASVTYTVSPQGQGVFVGNGVVNVLASAEAGIYQITQLVEGCGSDAMTLSLEVFESIDIDLSITSNSTCVGQPVSFEASLSEFQEILWNFGDGLEEIGYNTIDHLFFESGTYPVTASVTNSDGCSSSDVISVTVSGNDISILAGDSILCSSRVFRGGPSSNQFETIVWGITPTPQPFEVSYFGEEFEYRFLNNGDEIEEYVLSLTALNAQGCGSYDEMVIKVKPVPSVNLRWKEDPICELPQKLGITIEDYNSNWEYAIESMDPLEQIGAEISGNFTEGQIITVNTENEFGCRSSDAIELSCGEISIFVPNAVTPNGDNSNEVFQPILFRKPHSYELRITNRWGDCIFETTDWQKPWEVNSNEGGYYVPNGIYQWYIKYKSDIDSKIVHEKCGFVVVVR